MNDVGGSGSGNGLRAVKSSRTSDANFEYDDSEWDVGIGNLIIDLDADIEKNNEDAANTAVTTTGTSPAPSTPPTTTTASSPPTPASTNNPQMHIPAAGNSNTTASTTTTVPSTTSTPSTTTKGKGAGTSGGKTDITSNSNSPAMDHVGSGAVKGLKMKIKRSKPGTNSVDAKHEIVKSDVAPGPGGTTAAAPAQAGSTTTTKMGEGTKAAAAEPASTADSAGPGKIKPAKRGSTHKKPKAVAPSSTPTTTTQFSASPNKKERNPDSGNSNLKVNPNSTSSSTTTSGGTKELYGGSGGNMSGSSVAVGGGSSGNLSAFVKATGGLKGTTGSDGGGKFEIGSRNFPTTVNSSGTTTGSGQFVMSSLSGGSSLTAGKGDSAKNSSSSGSGHNLTTTDGKGIGANSPGYYAKKPRAFVQPEKNKWTPEDSSGSTGQGNSGSGATSPPDGLTSSFRSLNAGNMNSTSSFSATESSIGTHAGVPGTSNLNNFGIAAKEKGRCGLLSQSGSQDASVGTCVGTMTEPDCLGPCEPGTSVTLEGIVWHETENGVLVVNVTWRGKTYVGTLLDCTKNDWASPRFCDSPTSDLDIRNPKNRGKRGRAQAGTPVSDSSVPDNGKSSASKLRNGAKGRRGSASTSAAFVTPISPLKDPWLKRKTRGSENESQEESGGPTGNSVIATMAAAAVAAAAANNAAVSKKRLKLSSKSDGVPVSVNFGRRASSPTNSNVSGSGEVTHSPVVIECPEPNCHKKYKHINGLRYHQSHAHSANHFTPDQDSDSNLSTASNTTAPVGGAAGESQISVPVGVGVVAATAEPAPEEEEGQSQPQADDSASSTPNTTPLKKPNPEARKERENSNAMECDLTTTVATATAAEPVGGGPLTLGSSTATVLGKSKDEKMDTSGTPAKELVTSASAFTSSAPAMTSNPQSQLAVTTTTTLTRPAILTVPNVPFLSMQSRGQPGLGGMLTVPRVGVPGQSGDPGCQLGPLVLTKGSSSRESLPDSNVMKTGPPKSVPWQPHAHAHSIPSSGALQGQGQGHLTTTHGLTHTHTAHAHVISALHPQTPAGALTVPQPQSQAGKHTSSNLAHPHISPSKKPKHKKKSKDKRDRERDLKGTGPGHIQGSGFPPGIGNLAGRDSGKFGRKPGLFDSLPGEDGIPGSGSGQGQENRDDPQSPAYSDISDANDSGPESGPDGAKAPEGRKDPPEVSPFYPTFFPPARFMDQSNSASAGNSKDRERERATATPQEDGGPGGLDKSGKSQNLKPPAPGGNPAGPIHGGLGPLHSHGVGTGLLHPEERRTSPKIDYHPKYLPQQHFYPYPYGHPYHHPYDGHPPYGMGLPENPYAHSRVFMDDKEREREIQTQTTHGDRNPAAGRRRASGDGREEPPIPATSIKQETPDFEHRPTSAAVGAGTIRAHGHKDPRHMTDGGGGPTDFSTAEDRAGNSKRSSTTERLSSSSHRQSSSKRDREREDRHRKEAESKDPKGHRSHGQGHKGPADLSNASGNPTDDKEREKDQGSKPTMETQGPPPPPTAQYAYIPQGYLPGNPFLSYDPNQPLFGRVLVPGPYPGGPYGMHGGGMPRFPGNPGSTPLPLPEDLSRPSGSSSGGPQAKALDLLQHHAVQYYAAQAQHKIHELHDRAMKSPSPQVGSGVVGGVSGASSGGGRSTTPSTTGTTGNGGHTTPTGPGALGGLGLASKPSSPSGIGGPLGRGPGQGGVLPGATTGTKAADLSAKDTKPTLGVLGGGILGNESCRSPPTQHHVHSHTHHHTHVGIGYPIIPTVPPQYSPHYGVLSTPSPAAAATVIPPFPSQKPT